MHCGRCTKELPTGATHCPYCGADLATIPATPGGAANASAQTAAAERKAFCVKCGAPLPPSASFCTQCSSPRPGAVIQPPNGPVAPVYPVAGQVVCPRCRSTNALKGKIPQWALLVAIIGAPFTCLLSLLFLFVKDPNKCIDCQFEFK